MKIDYKPNEEKDRNNDDDKWKTKYKYKHTNKQWIEKVRKRNPIKHNCSKLWYHWSVSFEIHLLTTFNPIDLNTIHTLKYYARHIAWICLNKFFTNWLVSSMSNWAKYSTIKYTQVLNRRLLKPKEQYFNATYFRYLKKALFQPIAVPVSR